MVSPKEKYYIIKSPKEELHQVLVGDSEKGRVKAFSKIQPDRSIAYKIFIDGDDGPHVLHEDVGSSEQYQEVIKQFAEELLIPNGTNWREVQPMIIER